MRRTANLLFLVGGFLVVSILWPYDPGANISTSSARPYFAYTFDDVEPAAALNFPDEWGTATMKPILQATVPIVGLTEARTPLPIPADVRIPPGTDYLLVTQKVTTPDGSTPSVWLGYVAANDETREVPLLLDRPNKVEVNEEMNDWTPDPDSRWSFWLTASPLQPADAQIRIDAVRVPGRLPGLIEFNDQWSDEARMTLYNEEGSLADARLVPQSGVGLAMQPADSPPMKMPPPRDVSELRVVLEYNSSTPSDLHYRPTLSYRGADRESNWESQGVAPMHTERRQQDGRFEWVLPVEPRMWDSPFAERTRWDVLVDWRGESLQSPSMVYGDYHFWIESVRSS